MGKMQRGSIEEVEGCSTVRARVYAKGKRISANFATPEAAQLWLQEQNVLLLTNRYDTEAAATQIPTRHGLGSPRSRKLRRKEPGRSDQETSAAAPARNGGIARYLVGCEHSDRIAIAAAHDLAVFRGAANLARIRALRAALLSYDMPSRPGRSKTVLHPISAHASAPQW